MFVIFGERRINISLVKQYKAIEKSSFANSKTYYLIEFIFIDGSKEELHFFERKEDRNEYLKVLDQNLLENTS